eukprot:8803623-Alexandrium_andersonii.AAC.1
MPHWLHCLPGTGSSGVALAACRSCSGRARANAAAPLTPWRRWPLTGPGVPHRRHRLPGWPLPGA